MELSDKVKFTSPDGRVTVWTSFIEMINLEELAKNVLQKDLLSSNGKQHLYPHGPKARISNPKP